MMNKEKGITMISLVITMIVLVILASVTIYVGNDVINQAKLQTINTNMMLIQAKVKTIAEQVEFDSTTNSYVGTKLSEISDNKIQKLIDSGSIPSSDMEKCYFLSQYSLNSMGLGKVKVEDGYVVDYEKNEVWYVKGFEKKGEVYYKLSDMRQLTTD